MKNHRCSHRWLHCSSQGAGPSCSRGPGWQSRHAGSSGWGWCCRECTAILQSFASGKVQNLIREGKTHLNKFWTSPKSNKRQENDHHCWHADLTTKVHTERNICDVRTALHSLTECTQQLAWFRTQRTHSLLQIVCTRTTPRSYGIMLQEFLRTFKAWHITSETQ